MAGCDVLWQPGTDHAGIATQMVVKKQLDGTASTGRRDMGRDDSSPHLGVEGRSGGVIVNQLKRHGLQSCDWSRNASPWTKACRARCVESFVRLYREGLIYRGKRIVNWCPVDRTALSDDEVEQETEKGKMYHIRYPFQDDPTKYVVVATTRPETLFGDVAVAVNAKDERWSPYIGRNVVLPLQGRVIPVIADEHADPEKGTGVVKITPAHDPNDFEVGLRHNLAPIDVMNDDATMNGVVPERYRGLDRYKARAKALAELEELGLLEAVKDHVLAIGRSYRSKQPIEYRLSDQWFVKMGPLGRKALEASGFT
jgi:valyl-tRNA synthetase